VRLWGAATFVGWAIGALEGLSKAAKLATGIPGALRYDILVVAPILYGSAASLFAAAALGGWLLASLVRRMRPRDPDWLVRVAHAAPVALAIGPVAFVLFRSLFRLGFGTGLFAELLIVFGLTYQLTRLYVLRPTLVTVSARLLPAALALTLVVAITVVGGRSVSEGRVLGALPPAAPGAPNVLFITLDTLRADHLGAYGSTRPTPNLDRIAAEGTLFEYAIAPSSWTLPSHASMLTGLRVSEHLADHNTGLRLDERFLTVTEAFARSGYATAAFVANTNFCAASRGYGQGFAHYEDLFHDFPAAINETELGDTILGLKPLGGKPGREIRSRKFAAELNQASLEWLPGRGDRPFFVWLNYFDVHDPYFAPPPFERTYGARPANGIEPRWYAPKKGLRWAGAEDPPEGRMMADAYDCALAYLDEQIGRLYQALDEGGLLDNTILVVTSDHGEAFGEHGYVGHSKSLYREVVHVPLFIRFPSGVAPGVRVAEPADLCHLAATMLSLAGVPNDHAIPGTSLLAGGTGTAVAELMRNPYQAPFYQSARGDVVSIVTAEWQAIFSDDGAQLFARSDVRQQADLGATEAGRLVIDELRGRLEAALPGRELPVPGATVSSR
jgi:arylsulfatase A-like enzyme